MIRIFSVFFFWHFSLFINFSVCVSHMCSVQIVSRMSKQHIVEWSPSSNESSDVRGVIREGLMETWDLSWHFKDGKKFDEDPKRGII